MRLRRPAGLSPLRSQGFRRLWYASLAASGAQLMERTTTAWLAVQTGDAFTIGLVFAARSLPSLLFGLAAGTIADRSDRRRQLFAVMGAAALFLTVVGLLVAADLIRGWHVILISFGAGCVQVFDTTARQSLVLDTVTRDEAASALALNALAARGAGVAGALGAGFVIVAFGVGHTYLAIAALYILSALLATTVSARRRQPAGSPSAHPPFRRALADAARLIVELPAVRILTIAGLAGEIFAFSYNSALPVLVKDVLGVGAEGLGLLNAATSLGGTAAVLLLSLLVGRLRQEPLFGGLFLLYGASLITLAFTRSLALAFVVLLVTGVCAASFDLLRQVLLQLSVPEEQRGRAAGIWVIGLGSAPLGNLEMGALISATGAPGGLLVNGALTVLSAAFLLARSPAYRGSPRQTAPEPEAEAEAEVRVG